MAITLKAPADAAIVKNSISVMIPPSVDLQSPQQLLIQVIVITILRLEY
jgi:hypothetical protein